MSKRVEQQPFVETKTIQLCRQVEEAISCALATSASAILRDLYVVEVQPMRGAALMRILVSTEDPETDLEEGQRALERAAGYFRSEVAQSIHRKRVPALQFTLLPVPEPAPSQE